MTTPTDTWLAAVDAAANGGQRALPPAWAELRARTLALRHACADLIVELEIAGASDVSGLLAAITTAHADLQRAAAAAAEPVYQPYEPRKCRQCGRAVQARPEDGGCAC